MSPVSLCSQLHVRWFRWPRMPVPPACAWPAALQPPPCCAGTSAQPEQQKLTQQAGNATTHVYVCDTDHAYNMITLQDKDTLQE